MRTASSEEPFNLETILKLWLTVGLVDLTVNDEKLLLPPDRIALYDVSSSSGHIYAGDVSSSSARGVLVRSTTVSGFVEEIEDDGDDF